MYTIDYFIQKFGNIPEEQYCEYDFVNGNRRCVNGHCGIRASSFCDQLDGGWNKEAVALAHIFLPLTMDQEHTPARDLSPYYSNVAASINNGTHPSYPQPTPKQRILAALDTLKAMQEPKRVDVTKELATFPIDETSDVIQESVLATI